MKASNSAVKIPAPSKEVIARLAPPEKNYYLNHCTPAMRAMINNAAIKAQDTLRNVGEFGALDMCIKLARFLESQRRVIKTSNRETVI